MTRFSSASSPGSRSSATDLAQQRVAEAVAAVAVGGDDVPGHGVAQGIAQLVASRPAAAASSAWSHAHPDGEQAQQLLGGLAEGLDADQQRVAQRGGQLAAAVERRRRAAPR